MYYVDEDYPARLEINNNNYDDNNNKD